MNLMGEHMKKGLLICNSIQICYIKMDIIPIWPPHGVSDGDCQEHRKMIQFLQQVLRQTVFQKLFHQVQIIGCNAVNQLNSLQTGIQIVVKRQKSFLLAGKSWILKILFIKVQKKVYRFLKADAAYRQIGISVSAELNFIIGHGQNLPQLFFISNTRFFCFFQPCGHRCYRCVTDFYFHLMPPFSYP